MCPEMVQFRLVYLLKYSCNCFFEEKKKNFHGYSIIVPTAAPANVLADGYNSTAMEVTWDPVADTREVMKGRLYGYQVVILFSC